MSKKVMDLLNAARARELSAILQYMMHHYELDNDGYGKLAAKMKETAIQEMKHAEALGERIKFLDGEATTKPDAQVQKGQQIPEMLKTDMALETQAVKMYNEASVICAAEKDQVSRELFEKLLADEEAHWDLFRTIKDLLDKMGAAYLATLAD